MLLKGKRVGVSAAFFLGSATKTVGEGVLNYNSDGEVE